MNVRLQIYTSTTILVLAALLVPRPAIHAQLAKSKCKFLGNIIPSATPAGFANYWNQVTPENAGKWGAVENTRDVMSWTALDNAYKFAQDNNFPFKQHTLVWGQQQPPWMDALPAAEQKEEVEEWIRAFCERYPATEFIDVVNEPLHAVPAYAAALGGSGSTGWDWVIWSFEKARQYCPNARLALNDYNILSSNSATGTYIGIINLLKERNLIDIVGEQGHFLETTPLATIQSNLDKLSEPGLPVHISEYDVNLADDQAQLNKYKEQFPLLWSHKGVHGITLWGYQQGKIWRQDAYLLRSNGSARPALTWLNEYVKSSEGGTFCDPVTGMSESPGEIGVYPLPAPGGRFTVELGEGLFDIRVLDVYGNTKKQISSAGNQSVRLDINEPGGVYLLRVHDGTRARFRRILIN